MLINDFFLVEEIHSETNIISARISLNKEHAIFSGHFPQKPVVPGVCMVQMVREVLEADQQVRLQISSADNIKFLSIINPNEVTTVNLSVHFSLLENDRYKVVASIFYGDVIYFKLNGIFSVV